MTYLIASSVYLSPPLHTPRSFLDGCCCSEVFYGGVREAILLVLVEERQLPQELLAFLPGVEAGPEVLGDRLGAVDCAEDHADSDGTAGVVTPDHGICLHASREVVLVLEDQVDRGRQGALGWGGLPHLDRLALAHVPEPRHGGRREVVDELLLRERLC